MDTSTKAKPHHLMPDVTLIMVALIWGVNIPLMKSGLSQLPNVYVYNAIRLPISALVLSLFALRERRRGIVADPDVTWRSIAIYSAIVSALYQLCFLLGMDLTTSGNTALIIATVPIWTATLSHLFLSEKLKPVGWLGMLIAVAGTMVVALQKGISLDSTHFKGNLVVLASALLWAAGTVYSRPLLNRISALQLASTASVMALPAHIAVAAWNYSEGSLTPLGSPSLWAIILFSGTLSSGLAQPMWHFGVKMAGPAHAAIIQNLVPVFALGAVWLFVGTRPNQAQMIGGAMILLGLVVMRSSRR